MTTLRFRALLAKARSDEKSYRLFKEAYRAAAEKAGFETHVAVAVEMP
jgi:adenylate cyclase